MSNTEIDVLRKLNRELNREVEELKMELTERNKYEAKKDEILKYFVKRWDWTMQCEQSSEWIDSLRIGFGIGMVRDIELQVFLRSHQKDMEEYEAENKESEK